MALSVQVLAARQIFIHTQIATFLVTSALVKSIRVGLQRTNTSARVALSLLRAHTGVHSPWARAAMPNRMARTVEEKSHRAYNTVQRQSEQGAFHCTFMHKLVVGEWLLWIIATYIDRRERSMGQRPSINSPLLGMRTNRCAGVGCSLTGAEREATYTTGHYLRQVLRQLETSSFVQQRPNRLPIGS